VMMMMIRLKSLQIQQYASWNVKLRYLTTCCVDSIFGIQNKTQTTTSSIQVLNIIAAITTTKSNMHYCNRGFSTLQESDDAPNEGRKFVKKKKDPRSRLKKTALYDIHMEIGCKMVPYAGYLLPLYYNHSNGGIIKEHLWCRTPGRASLFDISHMGQFRVFDKDRYNFLESLMVSDVRNLKDDHACLSVLTNENGGILDTVIVSQCDDNVYMVVNGLTRSTDYAHFEKYVTVAGVLESFIFMYSLDKSHSLLSLQGPGAAAALQPLVPSNVHLHKIPFMTGIRTSINQKESCRITR
jgi:Aminomethyltransferase folate-binding domain